MELEKANKNYKDGIFRSLFNNEDELRKLYNALSGKNYPNDTPVKIVTLDNVIFNELKNDIAFLLDNRFIILTEHQSTLSPNLPLRMFCYLAREYEKLSYTKAVYSYRPVTIPTPELYVFYNGTQDAPKEWEMKLSDTFSVKCDTISAEAVIKVINVNYEKGAKLLEKCKTMKEYSLFIKMARDKFAKSHDLHAAVKETVRECINEGILAEYLMKQRGDIMSILEVDLTLEERDAIRMEDGYAFGMKDGIAQGLERGIAQGLERGIAQGLERGREDEQQAIILQMLKKGMDRELIKEITGADDALIDELS